MKHLLTLFAFVGITANLLSAQDTTSTKSTWKAKEWRQMSGTELIFSGGSLETQEQMPQTKNIVRFTLFFHLQSQWHYDFNRNVGFYLGAALRNVGFIHEWDMGNYDLKLKHRSYALGAPIALKLGNLKEGYYAAIGIEPELMFAYKRKVLVDNKRVRRDTEWFSDRVNIFNPSAFAEFRFKGGTYVRAKYYLNNFLTDKPDRFTLPGNLILTQITPGDNNLFSISIGTVIRTKSKKKQPAQKDEV